MTGAVHEELEPVRTGDERVLEVVGGLDHAVAWPNLVDVAVLPREPGAGEDEVDLLRRAVRMRRRRQLAGCDTDAIDADTGGSGRAAEHLPLRIHLTLGRAVPLDLVPVCKTHDGADY